MRAHWHTAALFAALLLLCVPSFATAAFTCCTGSGCSGGVSNNPVVCAALGDLYTATNGQNWTNSPSGGGWNAAAAGMPTDYCTFAAWSALCNGSGVVTSLCVISIPFSSRLA